MHTNFRLSFLRLGFHKVRSLGLKEYIVVCLALASSSYIAATAAEHPTRVEQTPKALFIIIDGIPADVIEATQTPNIDAIAGEGGYTRAYVGGKIGTESESPTVSSVGYQSLITGTWANKHNVYTNSPKEVNYRYWDIFRIAKVQQPPLSTALFSTWQDNRTILVGDGLEQAGGVKIDYGFDGFELDKQRFPHDLMSGYIRDIDELVAAEAARYVEAEGPDLSWVYLQYTDDVSHVFGDGQRQNAAVKLADDQVGAIWKAIQARTRAHNEDWLIVVTTDHGRDSKSGRGHGGQSLRERTTWIASNSSHLEPRFTENPAIVDILPSIAQHLGMQIPPFIAEQLDGQSFIGSKMVESPSIRN
ncbi:MAG: alkaline phosphatase family protein [Pseudomonadales bacterium]